MSFAFVLVLFSTTNPMCQFFSDFNSVHVTPIAISKMKILLWNHRTETIPFLFLEFLHSTWSGPIVWKHLSTRHVVNLLTCNKTKTNIFNIIWLRFIYYYTHQTIRLKRNIGFQTRNTIQRFFDKITKHFNLVLDSCSSEQKPFKITRILTL